MNWKLEQNHYLGAQRFRSPCHWLQGAKPGPISPVLRGGGKYVGWGGGGGGGWHLALIPFHAERKESRQWQDYVCQPGSLDPLQLTVRPQGLRHQDTWTGVSKKGLEV